MPDAKQIILPGQDFRLECGNWRLEISKALTFEVRLSPFVEQFNPLVELPLSNLDSNPCKSPRLLQKDKLGTGNDSSTPATLVNKEAETTTENARTVNLRSDYKDQAREGQERLLSPKASVLPSCEGAGKAAVPEHPALPDPSKSTSKLKAPVLHETVGETTRTTVFKGKRYGTVTAVKIARRPTTEATAREWKNESEILSKLQHPHVVNLVFYDARDIRLELEYVGPDLAKQVDDAGISTLSPDAQYRVWHDVSNALQYIHSQGISHCDIKPQNILLSDDNTRAVLCDFGQAIRDSAVHNGGTPRYIPPEYAAGGKRGHPGDIWAFGVTMLFVLGLTSLPSQNGWAIRRVSIDEMARQEMSTWIRTVKAIDVPSRHALVSRMLEERPRKRITAMELVQEVENMGLLQITS
ncbi:kinase-like protein [Zopfia rhizophila CBS 207.26]|uniref:Kinase-like protein n=1 Tax=Zopfia rhizophila CBS 207.26 TaxID=1314779 RepID=A0A6A6D787_9PEZI|nr:kinase-like protein [Zopfia rhizophila CBS 207.26]